MKTEARKEYNKIYYKTPTGKMKNTIGRWKRRGLTWATDDEIEGIYTLYLGSTNCETCNKEYKNSKDKHMDHCHVTNKFRNILCASCNLKIKDNNTSGINGISWDKNHNCWQYEININGKRHTKCSKDKEWLINYKLEFQKENLYIY
mgnify:CR=1 FL=1|tara:strand:+ start:439 stop:879 length:441 start_codon:yes stop_codon:yes gene_type:complete